MTDQRAPLFVPLKREWFEAFDKGTKTWEHRLMRRQWNLSQVQTGRRVTLSLGYGKSSRLHGVIGCIKVTPFDMSDAVLSALYPQATSADSVISFQVHITHKGSK